MPGDVVAEGVAVGDDVGDGVAPLAGQVDDAVAAVEGADGPATKRPPSPRGSIGKRMRPGSSPPAVVEIRAAPTTRSPKSSGCCWARLMMLIPPME